MNRADAPRAGWYPDPINKDRLRWWDGSDWTEDRRVGPRSLGFVVNHDPVSAGDQSARTDQRSPPVADKGHGLKSATRRSAASVRSTSPGRYGLTGQDASAIVDEVRRTTRSELARTTTRLSQQARDLRSELTPLIDQYVRRFLRWARWIALVGAVLYILYVFASAQVQTNLLEWLGDRIDAVISE